MTAFICGFVRWFAVFENLTTAYAIEPFEETSPG
jgi:hypothetical protein